MIRKIKKEYIEKEYSKEKRKQDFVKKKKELSEGSSFFCDRFILFFIRQTDFLFYKAFP